jgi:hypothetical protein
MIHKINLNIMPMEIFVSFVGDLATLGRSVCRDLSPATPFCRFLFFFLFVFREALGEWKFFLWQLLCAVTELSF